MSSARDSICNPGILIVLARYSFVSFILQSSHEGLVAGSRCKNLLRDRASITESTLVQGSRLWVWFEA
eukprot:1703365-Rhodomonas_salina.1